MKKSDNCKRYTDNISVLVSIDAQTPEKGCSYEDAMYSCQSDNFEAPDATTARMLRKKAEESLTSRGCNVDDMKTLFTTQLIGARSTEYSPEKLASLGMVSNCFGVGNDSNDVTHVGKAICKPQYDMRTADGSVVRNFDMEVSSSLSVCDASERSMPQVYEDLKKAAFHNLWENRGLKLDSYEDLACKYSILPSGMR